MHAWHVCKFVLCTLVHACVVGHRDPMWVAAHFALQSTADGPAVSGAPSEAFAIDEVTAAPPSHNPALVCPHPDIHFHEMGLLLCDYVSIIHYLK